MNTHQSPTLWYMWSEVIGGFYQSNVMVAAVNRSDAIQTALHAFDKWVEDEISDMGYVPIVSCFVDQPEHAKELATVRQQFHEELKSKFEQVPRRGLIIRSS